MTASLAAKNILPELKYFSKANGPKDVQVLYIVLIWVWLVVFNPVKFDGRRANSYNNLYSVTFLAAYAPFAKTPDETLPFAAISLPTPWNKASRN